MLWQLHWYTSQRGSPSITCPTTAAPQGTHRENGPVLTHRQSTAKCRSCPALWGHAGVPQATSVWTGSKEQKYVWCLGEFGNVFALHSLVAKACLVRGTWVTGRKCPDLWKKNKNQASAWTTRVIQSAVKDCTLCTEVTASAPHASGSDHGEHLVAGEHGSLLTCLKCHYRAVTCTSSTNFSI